MNKEFAHTFSLDWVEAWNSHDLDRILSHFTEDFEMNSPVIKQMMNEPTGILIGKKKYKGILEKSTYYEPHSAF